MDLNVMALVWIGLAVVAAALLLFLVIFLAVYTARKRHTRWEQRIRAGDRP